MYSKCGGRDDEDHYDDNRCDFLLFSFSALFMLKIVSESRMVFRQKTNCIIVIFPYFIHIFLSSIVLYCDVCCIGMWAAVRNILYCCTGKSDVL